MFAGGQGLPGKPLVKLCETLKIFWDKAIHHPFQTVWSQPLSESDCELQIEDHPAVQHQFHAWADQLSGLGYQLLISKIYSVNPLPTYGHSYAYLSQHLTAP